MMHAMFPQIFKNIQISALGCLFHTIFSLFRDWFGDMFQIFALLKYPISLISSFENNETLASSVCWYLNPFFHFYIISYAIDYHKTQNNAHHQLYLMVGKVLFSIKYDVCSFVQIFLVWLLPNMSGFISSVKSTFVPKCISKYSFTFCR